MHTQLEIFKPGDFLTLKEASNWATAYLKKKVSTSNITYLINYGRIHKYGGNGESLVSKKELIKYYESFNGQRELHYKKKLGEDLNWILSFDGYTEAETTKHVHRLHPYKGKFIPQLVEYFIDGQTDNFKKEVFFHKGDIIVDPFCGSGTALVQANELGINAIGIEVSFFNSFISNCKIDRYDLSSIKKEVNLITYALKRFLLNKSTLEFEEKLLKELNLFNNRYFPRSEFKRNVHLGKIDEYKYGLEKEKMFMPVYQSLVEHYNIALEQENSKTFIDKWYLKHVRDEIDFV